MNYYGIIPDIPGTYTSVTSRTTKYFKNSFGNFTYQKIKPNFFTGYETRSEKNVSFNIATPEKALVDYLYLNKNSISADFNFWKEMRIDEEFKFKKKKLDFYKKLLGNKKVNKLIESVLITKKMLDKFFFEDYIKRNGIPNIPRRVLTEYLQSEILAVVFNSKFGSHLSFLGGTCLRFVYKIERFSEDLDFDLIKAGFDLEELAAFIRKKLNELGFRAETTVKKRENVITINVKFSEVMKEMGLSDMADQKLKIKFEIDPAPCKNIRYESKQIFAYGKEF